MVAVTLCSDFRSQEEEILSLLPPFPLLFAMNGARCHDLSFFLIFGLKLTFSLSSYTLTERLFSSSSLSAIRVVSTTYLRLLLFLLPVLIPACNLTSPASLTMCSVFRLNNQVTADSPVLLLS